MSRPHIAPLPPVVVAHPHVHLLAELGGSPCVTGSRVPIRRLWQWHRGGAAIEVIVKRYPALGPAKILDALSFAYDNPALIEADIARERGELAERERSEEGCPTVRDLPPNVPPRMAE